MARARQYIRPLDAITSKFDFSQISKFNREIMIKQEPCDANNIKMNDNCVSTKTQCKYVTVTKDNSCEEENVPSITKNLSNNIITRRIRMKSTSMGNAVIGNSKHLQQKKRPFVVDESNKNVETLKKSDNIKRSKLKRNTKQLKNMAQCDICFVSFLNSRVLNFHKKYYAYSNKLFCKNCSSKSCYHIIKKNSKKVYMSKMYQCDICKAWFKHKERVQAHIFHNHEEEINGMNVIENDILMANHSTVSHSVTPIKDKVMQQKWDNERKTEGTVNENVCNSEASMCESITMIKEEIEWSDVQVDELSMDQIVSNVPQTENKPKENMMDSKPFVQIHVDRNMMEALLKISDDNFLDKSLPYDSNTDSNTNNDNNSSNNSIISKSYALRSLNNSKQANNSVALPTVVQKNNQSDDKLSQHLNACKKCTIPLVKCDSTINVTPSTKLNPDFVQFNTPSPLIPRSSFNRKSINCKLTPRKRKRTMSSDFNNCTPQMNHSKDLNTIDSSIEELPIKITRSRSIYSPLKLPMSDYIIDCRKNSRKKLHVKHRSVINQTMFGRKLARSPRKDNIKNSEVSPTVAKLNTEVLENKKVALNNLKLKEVKISLIKLPKIKNETMESTNIGNEITPEENFPCQICNSSLNSEKDLKKHVRKCHTAYISTICKARYTTKRLLLKHYLKEHDTWTRKCCVCQEFLTNRLLLKQHLLLHCVKITLSKKDRRVLNKNFKCNSFKNYNCKPTAFKIILRLPKSSKRHLKINHSGNNYDVNELIEHQKIYNNDKNNQEQTPEEPEEINNDKNNQEQAIEPEEINNDKNNQEQTPEEPEEINNDKNNQEQTIEPEEINNREKSIEILKVDDNDNDDHVLETLEDNFNVNNAENITKQVSKSKENDDAGVIEKRNKPQIDSVTCINLTESLESDNTEVPCSSNMIEKSILDPLQIVDSTFIICKPNEGTQSKLTTLNIINLIQPSVNDSKEPIKGTEITAEKKKYPCSICKQLFNKFESLQKHKRTYDPSFNNYCAQCGLFFSTKKVLKNHMDATHNISIRNSYKMHCQFCNQGFRTQNNLRIHELHYHSIAVTVSNTKITDFLQIPNNGNNRSTETTCKICGHFFDNVELYQLHDMYFCKDHIFPCKLCNKVFHGLYMIHSHNKMFHPSEDTLTFFKYKCIHCHEGFTSEMQLQEHMSHVHPNIQENNKSTLNFVNYNETNKSYVCSKCNIEFFSVTELFMHIEYFSNHGNYKCSICSRKCCNLSILNDHMHLTHIDNGLTKSKMCDICGEVLISETFLFCHRKHVHGDLENEQIISSDTDSRSTTNLHIDEITNDDVSKIDNEPVALKNSPNSSSIIMKKYNFSCSICPVKFDKEIYLKEHLIEYLDYGDYQCDECLRRFANSDFLKKHVQNHLKPNMTKTKYYCILCNEVCKSSMVLESHVAHLHARIIFKDDSPKKV